MPRKGMRSIFFNPSPSSDNSFMDDNIETDHALITKYHSQHSNISLFTSNRREAKQYLHAVKSLQASMLHLIAQDSTSQQLIQSQLLMQLAMTKLGHEFHHLLSTNRQFMDSESLSTRSSTSSDSRSINFSDFDDDDDDESVMLAMSDLRVIADCMISSGYGKECIRIYKTMRKSMLVEALLHLGFENLSSSQIKKLDWEFLESKIKNWTKSIQVAVTTLFYNERTLCNQVFTSSEKMREACFAEISLESATCLFRFPELLVAKCKKLTPEKIFRILDMYEAMIDHIPQIQSIFSSESTSTVRSQAVTSLSMLAQSVRTLLSDFETAIQRESSKKRVPGGGVHPLTRYVMNYVILLNDYNRVLLDIIIADSPLPSRLAWVITVLLGKLDVKAENYKDDALSYLFLANNLQYIVGKVRTSSLGNLLGDEWLKGQDSRIKDYVSKYERIGWGKVVTSLPGNITEEVSPKKVKMWLRSFNVAFDETYRKQKSWIVSDPKLRDEIEGSIVSKLMLGYRELYEKYRVGSTEGNISDSIGLSPDELENYLGDMLHGKV